LKGARKDHKLRRALTRKDSRTEDGSTSREESSAINYAEKTINRGRINQSCRESREEFLSRLSHSVAL
jgi:hypothetical protein